MESKGTIPWALSKSKGGTPALKYSSNVGDLIHIKSEGHKHNIYKHLLLNYCYQQIIYYDSKICWKSIMF